MATLTTSYQKIGDKYIGTVSGSGVAAKDIYVRIYAKYNSQDIAGNKSTVSYKSTLYVSGSGTYFYTGATTTKSLSGTGATTKSGDASGDYYLGETTLYETTGTVTHGSSGAASVSVSASWSSAPWGVSGSVTASADLPTIARATKPTLSSTSVNVGESITITVKPAVSTFKHQVTCTQPGSTTLLHGVSPTTISTGTTFTFTPDAASYGPLLSTVKSGTFTITVYTVDANNNSIGSESVNVTVVIPATAPTVSISVSKSNLLSSEMVQGKSSVTIDATISTSYSATVKSIAATFEGVTYTKLPFTAVVKNEGTASVSVKVTDSRDLAQTATNSFGYVNPYTAPQITEFTLARQSDGTTVIATVKGSIASVNSKNAKTVKVTLNGKTNTITASSYTISGTTTFTGVPTDNSLTATATFTDSFNTVTKNAVLPTVAVTMDFHSSGKGVAFGKVAETEAVFDVSWRIKNYSVPTLVGGQGTVINASVNLNTLEFLALGNYVCPSDNDAKTLTNCPSTYAFKMVVFNCLSERTKITDDTYIYLVRILTNYRGDIYVQSVRNEGSGWNYSAWRTVVDSGNFATYFNNNFSTSFATSFASSFSSSLSSTVKDYVVEQGEKDFWTYRKWNSGIAECWGNKSATPTTVNGTNTISVSLPFTFAGTGYTVDISPAKTGLYISAMGDCNANGDLSHTTSSFTMAYRYNSGTAYGVSFNLHVHGKWK